MDIADRLVVFTSPPHDGRWRASLGGAVEGSANVVAEVNSVGGFIDKNRSAFFSAHCKREKPTIRQARDAA